MSEERRLGFERRWFNYAAHIPERRKNGGRRWNDRTSSECRVDNRDACVHVEKEVKEDSVGLTK